MIGGWNDDMILGVRTPFKLICPMLFVCQGMDFLFLQFGSDNFLHDRVK